MKFNKQHLYQPVLAIAGALFIYSAVLGAPREVLVRTNAMLANATIGTSAAVEPNSYNSLAQQLTDKETELASREKNLAQQENRVPQSMPTNLSLYSFLMSLLLAILVGVNFYFDWRRGRSAVTQDTRSVINLRSRG